MYLFIYFFDGRLLFWYPCWFYISLYKNIFDSLSVVAIKMPPFVILRSILGGNISFNHLCSRTDPRAQAVVSLAWKHINLELERNCQKEVMQSKLLKIKKIKQNKINACSPKQSKAQKKLFRNGWGTTYIILKIIPELGSRKYRVIGYICLLYVTFF